MSVIIQDMAVHQEQTHPVVFLQTSSQDSAILFEQLAQVLATIAERIVRSSTSSTMQSSSESS